MTHGATDVARFICYDELKPKKGIGYSKTQLWRKEKDGTFPRRVRIGAQRHAWLENEIDNWIAARAAEREGAAS
jgi:prophage regulatory protein